MGIMEQANKLKGKEKEQFLKEYHEIKNRLKESQDNRQQVKKVSRKNKKSNKNGKVVISKIDEI